MNQRNTGYYYETLGSAALAPKPKKETAGARDNTTPKAKDASRFSHIPVSKNRVQEKVLPAQVITFAKIFVVVMCFAACVAICSVFFTSTALVNNLAAAEISENIVDAQSETRFLEAQKSALTTTGNLKTSAGKMGMGIAEESVTISLPEDVVAVDEAGNLSLSQSVLRAMKSA